MKLKFEDYPFTLLTPAMIGGAAGKGGDSEMRAASIRGQIRWWHRKAGLSPSCNEVWGQTDGEIIASKIGVAVLPHQIPNQTATAILPHKKSAQRNAISANQTFNLRLTRLVDCKQNHWEVAQKAVKIWLLLGGIGLRVNRSAGSVWPLNVQGREPWIPLDELALKRCIQDFGYRHEVQLADASMLSHLSLNHEHSDAAKLRTAASDTVSVPAYFGGINPRTPSPLKIKVIRLGSDYRLLLTGLATPADFAGARRALGGNKPLGSVLWG